MERASIVLAISVFVILVALPIAWCAGIIVRWQRTNAREIAAAARQAAWVRENVRAEMTRQQAYSVLKQHGLVAYNWAFTKGKRTRENECDYSDRSSSAWPYRGEPMPSGPCSYGDRSPRSPDATIDLPSGTTLGCGFTTYITVYFSETDRVRSVGVERESTCV